jgi:hypothetical protein
MMLDMTLLMRPFFWLSVAFLALAPAAIVAARNVRRPALRLVRR